MEGRQGDQEQNSFISCCDSSTCDLNGSSGRKACEKCRCQSSNVQNNVLERKSSEDWFGELGSLTDDEPQSPSHDNQNQINGVSNTEKCSQGTDNEERPVCNSCNQEKSNDQKKAHRPKLETHMSWRDALRKARNMPDPWEKFHIDDSCPTEIAIRHRFNALKNSWVKDEVRVKMELLPFDQGAMRECFRLKKLSNFSKHMNWKHAANYVCKRYIDDVSRDVYFEDVRLQMDAKLWGEEYNRYNPPKKVDIFQVCVIEMKERKGSPLFHLEHFIEGTYIKYNSNSGYVLQNETLRCTPQAFSHFTFERSGHERIVVDIQGVGDLYTDPQIHTSDGEGYGEANLGPRGMALFFSSHKCNKICETLGLSQFDLSDSEMDRIEAALKNIQDSSTILRSSEECISPGRKVSSAIYDMTEYLAQSPPPSPIVSEPDSPLSSLSSSNGLFRYSRQTSESESSETESDLSDVFTENEDEDAQKLFAAKLVHKASSVHAEVELIEKVRQEQEQEMRRQKSVSILGQVHLELAKYNEIGRFTDHEPDMESAMFHLEQAATCGVPSAVVTMAEIYLQLPHDLLSSASVQESEDAINRGVEYMLKAATLGDRQAMVYMAKAYDTATGLGTQRSRSWTEAANWYQNAIDIVNEDDSPENSLFTDPNYVLCAKQAQLYHQGGYGLEKDPQTAGDLYSEAGDLAIAHMKGKLANKYYALAEEAWAEVEE